MSEVRSVFVRDSKLTRCGRQGIAVGTGEDTEVRLRRIVREERLGSPTACLNASQMINYLRYLSPATDPLSAKLVGVWRLEGRRERIDVDFANDI